MPIAPITKEVQGRRNMDVAFISASTVPCHAYFCQENDMINLWCHNEGWPFRNTNAEVEPSWINFSRNEALHDAHGATYDKHLVSMTMTMPSDEIHWYI